MSEQRDSGSLSGCGLAQNDHEALGLSSEGVLKEVGKLAVTIRDVLAAGSSGSNNVAKVGETLVDVLSFLQLLPFDV